MGVWFFKLDEGFWSQEKVAESAGLHLDLHLKGSFVDYAERDFFHSNGGNSKWPALQRYTLACATALSFPCSISSTSSEGAIQFFAFTLYTDAWTQSALRSENNRKCSSPTLTSAQTP